MQLPEDKLKEVEYYECYTGKTSYQADGKPVQKDIIILHFGEWIKKWKLFGFVLWSKTVKDRTKKFVFGRERKVEDLERGMYSFYPNEEFKEFRRQLEAYFDDEFHEVYKELQNHEIDYITS